jgi:hypothetical protein
MSLTFASALLVSASGCSGSNGPGAGGTSEEGKKLLDDRMKENKEGKATIKVPGKK